MTDNDPMGSLEGLDLSHLYLALNPPRVEHVGDDAPVAVDSAGASWGDAPAPPPAITPESIWGEDRVAALGPVEENDTIFEKANGKLVVRRWRNLAEGAGPRPTPPARSPRKSKRRAARVARRANR